MLHVCEHSSGVSTLRNETSFSEVKELSHQAVEEGVSRQNQEEGEESEEEGGEREVETNLIWHTVPEDLATAADEEQTIGTLALNEESGEDRDALDLFFDSYSSRSSLMWVTPATIHTSSLITSSSEIADSLTNSNNIVQPPSKDFVTHPSENKDLSELVPAQLQALADEKTKEDCQSLDETMRTVSIALSEFHHAPPSISTSSFSSSSSANNTPSDSSLDSELQMNDAFIELNAAIAELDAGIAGAEEEDDEDERVLSPQEDALLEQVASDMHNLAFVISDAAQRIITAVDLKRRTRVVPEEN